MAVNGPGEQTNLHVKLAVSQSEAVEGTTRLLYLPGGRTLNVIIPPGTQSGQVIRIEGQGLPATNGNPAGALLITVTFAQNEQYGSSFFSTDGSDAPTELHAPPPPPVYPGYAHSQPSTLLPPSASSSLPLPTPLPSVPLSTPLPSSYYAPGQLGPTGRSPLRNGNHNRRVMTVAVIVGLVVLLAASGLTYYAAFYAPNQQHKMSVQQTATAQTTALAQANMTGTAQASATAYPQNLYSQITSQKPIFDDSLSKNTANAWDENSHCAFTNGSYHATAEQTGYFFYCMNNTQTYHNFAFQVKMTFVRGSLGGIIFRADTQNSKYYLLRIDRSGRYDLFLYVDSNVQHVKKLGGDSTDAVSPYLNQANLITLIVRGNTCVLYIDSQYIVTITDPAATFSSGNIGVTAEDYNEASEVSYQQAELWKL